jgi:hypothetical protein
MSKAGKYNIRHIRWNYTYTVYEIALLFCITPDTVFRWIREQGLERVEGTKKYYVHSSALIAFIKKLNRKNKHPTQADTMFCCKCRCAQKPEKESLYFSKTPSLTIHVSGLCSVCNTRINKVISATKWHKKHPLYPVLNAPTNIPNVEQLSLRKCQTKPPEQLCLDLTLPTRL